MVFIVGFFEILVKKIFMDCCALQLKAFKLSVLRVSVVHITLGRLVNESVSN